jgi:dephospho-CoA kinase
LKHAVIISGPNGSGKSTFATEYVKDYKYDFINADEIEKKLENPGTVKSHLQAGRIFFKNLKNQIVNNNSFINELEDVGSGVVEDVTVPLESICDSKSALIQRVFGGDVLNADDCMILTLKVQ